jgi:hypothetical protein
MLDEVIPEIAHVDQMLVNLDQVGADDWGVRQRGTVRVEAPVRAIRESSPVECSKQAQVLHRYLRFAHKQRQARCWQIRQLG